MPYAVYVEIKVKGGKSIRSDEMHFVTSCHNFIFLWYYVLYSVHLKKSEGFTSYSLISGC